jgi:hypothetical protein
MWLNICTPLNRQCNSTAPAPSSLVYQKFTLLCRMVNRSRSIGLRYSRTLCGIVDSWLPTLQDSTSTPFSRAQQSKKMPPIRCPEMSVTDRQLAARNIPEERRTQLLRRGGNIPRVIRSVSTASANLWDLRFSQRWPSTLQYFRR